MTPAAIRASEAVRLLADRAAAQGVPLAWDEPAAAVAGRICRRLDGIPLAVELAAARLRVMPAAELDARLDERFSLLTGGSRAALPRQQTLRAMVDWSWELLTGAERAVLAGLSVFAGGFGLAAAEAVAAGPDVPPGEVVGPSGRAGGQEPGPVRRHRRRARAGTGCWKPSGSTRPAGWTRWARRRRTPPGPPTATTTWPWPRRPPRT